MTDIVERLRTHKVSQHHGGCADCYAMTMEEAADEIERLRELLRGTGANRYWEARWRDEIAEVERLRAEIERLKK